MRTSGIPAPPVYFLGVLDGRTSTYVYLAFTAGLLLVAIFGDARLALGIWIMWFLYRLLTRH